MTYTKENEEKDRELLHQTLEERYGPAMAQDIMDQLERTQRGDAQASYLLIKALCDISEMFRGETKAALKALRLSRDKWAQYGGNVTPLDKPTQEAEFRKIYRLYWVSMKAFYPLYSNALSEAQKPKFPLSSKPSGAPFCRTA